MIVRYREVANLSVAQAHALLTPEMVDGLLGVKLAPQAQEDEVLLPDALDGHRWTAAEWRARLEGVCVPLLDVNMATIESLLRVPGLSVDEAQTLVKARPYLDMEELGHEGSDLKSIGMRVARYVGHDGYLLWDKPVGRMVAFDVDLAAGVLVGHLA